MGTAIKVKYSKPIISKGLKERIDHLGKLIGSTPLFQLKNVIQKPGVRIFAKLEWMQMGGSVKARPAYNIIKEAIQTGELNSKRQLLDASSGNTAIAYAAIAASLNIPLTICLPENASVERKSILSSLGVSIVYTSKFEGTDGAQRKARELFNAYPKKYYYADQYSNVNNWKAHFLTTGPEIVDQTQNEITHFVAGLGTTGSFTGIGRYLKALDTNIQLVALQPDHPLHGLEGWKHMETAKVPEIYDSSLHDRMIEIDTMEAYDIIKYAARKEGLLLSPSAAANLTGAMKLAKEIDSGTIVTSFADNADKYSEVYKNIF